MQVAGITSVPFQNQGLENLHIAIGDQNQPRRGFLGACMEARTSPIAFLIWPSHSDISRCHPFTRS
jgi:hypothetical protein